MLIPIVIVLCLLLLILIIGGTMMSNGVPRRADLLRRLRGGPRRKWFGRRGADPAEDRVAADTARHGDRGGWPADRDAGPRYESYQDGRPRPGGRFPGALPDQRMSGQRDIPQSMAHIDGFRDASRVGGPAGSPVDGPAGGPARYPRQSSSLKEYKPMQASTSDPMAAQTQGPGYHPDALRPPVLDGSPAAARAAWRMPVESSQATGIAADHAVLGDLTVCAASVVGPGHRCEEPAVPRQDAYRLGRDKAGTYLIVAVADGMSDSARSDLGATVATATAVNELRAALDRGEHPQDIVAADVFRSAAQQMTAAAKGRGLQAGDVRCTLLAMVVPTQAEPDGTRLAWIGSLADTSAWLREPDGWEPIAGEVKNDGLDANTLSRFLPYHAHESSTRLFRLAPRSVVTVVTDGVADAFTGVSGGGAWFSDRWKVAPPIASFLLDVSYDARGHLDDRTAVTIWCDGTPTARG